MRRSAIVEVDVWNRVETAKKAPSPRQDIRYVVSSASGGAAEELDATGAVRRVAAGRPATGSVKLSTLGAPADVNWLFCSWPDV